MTEIRHALQISGGRRRIERIATPAFVQESRMTLVPCLVAQSSERGVAR